MLTSNYCKMDLTIKLTGVLFLLTWYTVTRLYNIYLSWAHYNKVLDTLWLNTGYQVTNDHLEVWDTISILINQDKWTLPSIMTRPELYDDAMQKLTEFNTITDATSNPS